MKTQANKTLHFTKQSIIELNDAEIYNIKGGGSTKSIAIESMVSDILGTRNLCNSILAVMNKM